MDKAVFERVQAKLLEIEAEHTVRILYAAESGSRAWGFESRDSDYDVRFIYAHNKNWYLNILPQRDVIEYPVFDAFDYSGWDLRKALLLIHKSNPVLFEWLKSPAVYRKDEHCYHIMEELSKEYFSQKSSLYHYLHMAKKNYLQFLQGDAVKIKKYFYVLRPILACMWIENYWESPPVEFDALLTKITEHRLLCEINALLAKKKSGIELDLEPRIEILHDFIEKALKHFECAAKTVESKRKPKQNILEAGFIDILEYHEPYSWSSPQFVATQFKHEALVELDKRLASLPDN